MTFQFSIFGYLIMAVCYSLSVGLLMLVWHSIRTWWGAKTIITILGLVVIALPWADEVWISYHFNKACEDAGVHVIRQVEVDGYYNSTTTGWSKSQLITDESLINLYEKQGFRFQERNTRKGVISHVEKGIDGLWRVSLLDEPTARYHVRTTHNHDVIGYQLKKYEKDVFDSQEGDIIGRQTSYARYPNALERLWIGLLGSGQTMCYRPIGDPKKEYKGDVVKRTIIPVTIGKAE